MAFTFAGVTYIILFYVGDVEKMTTADASVAYDFFIFYWPTNDMALHMNNLMHFTRNRFLFYNTCTTATSI